MNSIYFLPYTGIEKFDEINNKLKTKLLEITQVVAFPIEKQINFYPENSEKDISGLIFVPTIFDYRNAVSYQGVEFALRWYFYVITLNKKCNFKIILLGIEDKSTFFQNCNYSNFLKCPNVDYLQNSYEAINQYQSEDKVKEFDQKEALEKIKTIGIKPPTSYKTHHSIANEWSILRWAKALKIDTEKEKELKKIESNIETDLYYKYLNTIYPTVLSDKFKSEILLNSGKILFIDDEVEKGWGIIFKKICKDKNYSSFGKDFKNWEKSKIIDESFEKAKDADVVILDLRLHDDDFHEKDSKKITGFKILEKIKEYNKGIQVIIFSATNKIWNLQALQEAEADGFILKESPEDSLDENFTTQSIKNIFNIIDNCLKMKFLKLVRIELDQLKKLCVDNNGYENFFNSIDNDLEISFELLTKTKLSNKYFSYAYLQLFQIIENFISIEEVFIEGDDSFVKLKNQEVCVQSRSYEKLQKSIKLTSNGKYEIKENKIIIDKYQKTKRLDTNFKVSAILIYKYGNINSSIKKWTDIYTIRNTKAAHYNSDNELDSESVFILINFIRYFIDSRNEKNANITKGLPIKTDSEKLEMLKAKHNKSKRR